MRDKTGKLAANGLLALLSLLFILAVAEIAARILAPGSPGGLRPFEPYFVSGDAFNVHSEVDLLARRESPSDYGYKSGYLTYVYSPEKPASAFDRTNFLFDHEISRYTAGQMDSIAAKYPGSIRIFVAGGSAAQGYGASGKEKTWHALMEARLRRHFHREDIYVFNAAMGAFVTAQERIAFDFAVAPRKPDLTIILNGFNDMYIPGIFGVRPGDPYQTGYRYYQIYNTSAGRFIRERSALAAWLAGRLTRKVLVENSGASLTRHETAAALGRGIVNVYTANVDYLIGRGTADSPVLVFFQPWRDFALHGAGGKPQSVFFRFYLRVSNDIRKHFAGNSGFIDISSSMSSPEKTGYFLDMAHLNDQGQQALADAVFPAAAKRVERIIINKTPGSDHEP